MEIFTDYQGHPIRLTRERWLHIVQHVEMVGMKNSIEETLDDPVLVVRSATDETVILNYRHYSNTIVGDKWLCVAVKHSVYDAFVLTAYLTDKPKQGEVIWRKL